MSLADRDLINTDGTGYGQSRQVNLLLHVELIEIFHRAVMQTFHLGDGLVRHIPAQLAHLHGKALVIEYLDANPSVRTLNSCIERSWLNQDRADQIETHLKNNRDKLISLKAEIYNSHNG